MTDLYKLKHVFSKDATHGEIISVLTELMPDNIYSFIVRRNNGYKCQITLCNEDKYNTISKDEAMAKIFEAIISNKEIAYAQPSLDIQLELFQPYIHALAREQQHRWQYLEYDDLLQICYLSLTRLYRKGYYINNLLLRTTYIRDVLLHIRKSRTSYTVISIEDTYGKDDSMSIADTLEDVAYANEQSDKEQHSELLNIFDEVKNIIIGIIGERRFEQMYREYANKVTTNSTRQTVTKIKRNFNRNGITLKSFRR